MERVLRNIEIIDGYEQLENVINQRIPRVIFSDPQNPFEIFRDDIFQGKFLFRKHQFMTVLDKFKDKFATSMPGHSPLRQFTVYMTYVRSNGFLRDVSTQNYVELPIPTVHKIVNSVAKDIAFYSRNYIVYPNKEEQNIIAARILEKYGFPGCSRIMDGCQRTEPRTFLS